MSNWEERYKLGHQGGDMPHTHENTVDHFHEWKSLGDPCKCGSDNCFKCSTCGVESYD